MGTLIISTAFAAIEALQGMLRFGQKRLIKEIATVNQKMDADDLRTEERLKALREAYLERFNQNLSKRTTLDAQLSRADRLQQKVQTLLA